MNDLVSSHTSSMPPALFSFLSLSRMDMALSLMRMAVREDGATPKEAAAAGVKGVGSKPSLLGRNPSSSAGNPGGKGRGGLALDVGEVVQRQHHGHPDAGSSPATTAPLLPTLSAPVDMETARDIVRQALGHIHPIAGATVHYVTNPILFQEHDRWHIEHHVLDPFTHVEWQRGDSFSYQTELIGFYEDQDIIYVDQNHQLPATTIHELLHRTCAPDFDTAFGRVLKEGATEYLTQVALARSGISERVTEVSTMYQNETALVRAIATMVGEDVFEQAYFNGGGGLNQLLEALGRSTFERVRNMAENGDWATADRILQQFRLH